MLQLNSLTLSNFLMWKNQSFDFLPGITMIGGENRSGKTLFFIRGITTALWGADAAKRGTDASKMPEGSKSIAKFRSGAHDWAVTATSSRVSLVRDGKTLGLSGKKSGRSHFQELFGGPMDLYDSSVMVSCSKPNPLVLAPPLQRADWFGALFGIDEAIEKAHEGVSEAIGLMRKDKTELTFLEDQLKVLRAEMEQFAPKTVDATVLVALQQQYRRADKRVRDYHRALDLLQSLRDYDKTKILKDSTYATLTDRVKQLREDIEAAKVKAETARELAKAMARRDAVEKAVTRLRAQIKDAAISPQAANSILMRLKPIHKKLANRSQAWPPRAAAIRRLENEQRIIARILKSPPSKEQMATALAEYQSATDEVNSLSATLKTLGSGVKGGECPHCGGKVSPKALRAKVEAAQKKLAAAEKMADQAYQTKLYADNAKEIARLTALAPDRRLLKFLRRVRVSVVDISGRPERVVTFEQELAHLPKRQAVVSVDGIEDMQRELHAALSRVVDHEREKGVRDDNARIQKILAEVLDLPDRVFKTSDAAQYREALKKARERRDVLLGKVNAAERAIAVLDNLDSRIKKLETKIASVKKAVADLPFVEILHKAFGRSGLRLTRIGELVDAFEATVNEGASLLLPDGYAFRMSTTDAGVDIKYRRPGDIISDLSVLSGSEDKCWRLLCALALVRMCPSNMRVDTIVLDEMESLMSAVTRERFAKDFMPVLAEAVSKVVVVSPMTSSQLPINFDRRFNVEMKNGVSTLVRQ